VRSLEVEMLAQALSSVITNNVVKAGKLKILCFGGHFFESKVFEVESMDLENI
jgi:hypothetical protein